MPPDVPHRKKHHPAHPHGAPGNQRTHPIHRQRPASHRLTYAEVAKLVHDNNVSGQPDTLIVALIYKESRFDPTEKSKVAGSSATGLMQMTKTAVAEVNRVDKSKIDFATMTQGAANIATGSRYLALRIKRAGNLKDGLNGFGTGPGYADGILAAQSQLTTLKQDGDPMAVLATTIGKF